MEAYVVPEEFSFSSDGSNICGAWPQIPSHSRHLNSECADYIQIPQPLTWFSIEELFPPSAAYSQGAAALPGLHDGLQSTLL